MLGEGLRASHHVKKSTELASHWRASSKACSARRLSSEHPDYKPGISDSNLWRIKASSLLFVKKRAAFDQGSQSDTQIEAPDPRDIITQGGLHCFRIT